MSIKLDELQALIDRANKARMSIMPSVLLVREMADALIALRDEVTALRIVLRTQADDLERGNLARTKLTTEVIALRREKAVLVRELRAIDARCPEWRIGNEARAALQPTERGEHGK